MNYLKELGPWPEWVQELRPHQEAAVEQSVDAFERGAKVVFLDAPTGSGKTLIGEVTRRALGHKGLYLSSSLTLQDQFARDFPEAKIIKGRSNYPTLSTDFDFPELTAADCDKVKDPDTDEYECSWCGINVFSCPYEEAKSSAISAEVAVLNSIYYLIEANNVKKFSGRQFICLDECDIIEDEIMRQVGFEVRDRVFRDLGVAPPKKGIHKKSIRYFIEGELIEAIDKKLQGMYGQGLNSKRRRMAYKRLKAECQRIIREIESEDNWVRDNNAGPLVLKPIKIDMYGERMLWRHAQRWLCMSATIISADQMAKDLGLKDEYDVVRVPMTFPVENRRIFAAPIANVTRANEVLANAKLALALKSIMSLHPTERILVHTVSYARADYLAKHCLSTDRKVLTYRNSRERESVLQEYRDSPGAILLAPSMDRGVDFADEDCRVVVVAKVPFPYLGDLQVSSRMRSAGGKDWYQVQTVRTLVQQTGRGVRSADDWCTTYILDSQFVDNVWKSARFLLPEWWKDALDFSFPIKKLQGKKEG